jgi:uncharacterized protein YlxP (DUF503 family)
MIEPMWIGWIEFDVLLGDVHSLKEKRSIVRPLVADLRRTFTVAVAESDSLDLHRRAGIGVSVVAADSKHVIDVLDAVDNFMAGRPEIDLLSAHRGVVNSDDE